MKRTILIIMAVMIIFPLSLQSQNENIKRAAKPGTTQTTSKYARSAGESASIPDQGVSGGAPCSPGFSNANSVCYLEPGWCTGSVLLADNQKLENVMLRYDLYYQQLQFVREKDTLAFAKPEEIQSFNLGGQRFINIRYENENIIKQGFFEVLSDGDCKLLLRRTVKYHVEPQASLTIDEDLFVRECSYYLLKDEELAKPVRACKKSVLCAFKDKEQEIKQFLDENDLKMNSCEELKTVVDYYNSLN